DKPVRALEESASAIRRLLAGERVSTTGDHVNLADVQLEQAPAGVPPVVLGVRRPFGLRASGRSADGTILAEPTPPAYIRAARAEIERGRTAAGRTGPHVRVACVRTRLDPARTQVGRGGAPDLLREGTAAPLEPLGRG